VRRAALFFGKGLSKNRRNDGTMGQRLERTEHHSQLAAISSPSWRDGADDRTAIIAN